MQVKYNPLLLLLLPSDEVYDSFIFWIRKIWHWKNRRKWVKWLLMKLHLFCMWKHTIIRLVEYPSANSMWSKSMKNVLMNLLHILTWLKYLILHHHFRRAPSNWHFWCILVKQQAHRKSLTWLILIHHMQKYCKVILHSPSSHIFFFLGTSKYYKAKRT